MIPVTRTRAVSEARVIPATRIRAVSEARVIPVTRTRAVSEARAIPATRTRAVGEARTIPVTRARAGRKDRATARSKARARLSVSRKASPATRVATTRVANGSSKTGARAKTGAKSRIDPNAGGSPEADPGYGSACRFSRVSASPRSASGGRSSRWRRAVRCPGVGYWVQSADSIRGLPVAGCCPETCQCAFPYAGQSCSCGRAGYSGLPQRLQKAAALSWWSLWQCGQSCSSWSSPRIAVASSAVKMPVGTAMIE